MTFGLRASGFGLQPSGIGLRAASALALVGFVLAACVGPQGRSKAPPLATERDPDRPALAEAGSEWPYLSVRVTDVARVGEFALKINFLFINSSTGKDVVSFASGFGAAADAGAMADAYLFDEVNRRKYFVMRDDGDHAECSSGIGPIGPGERRALWATFAAPPRGVTRVTVRVPHVEPLDVRLQAAR